LNWNLGFGKLSKGDTYIPFIAAVIVGQNHRHRFVTGQPLHFSEYKRIFALINKICLSINSKGCIIFTDNNTPFRNAHIVFKYIKLKIDASVFSVISGCICVAK